MPGDLAVRQKWRCLDVTASCFFGIASENAGATVIIETADFTDDKLIVSLVVEALHQHKCNT